MAKTGEVPGERSGDAMDTLVVPARPKGFHEVFVGERRWPNVKIDKKRMSEVKFVAVYQTVPVSAITHYAEIDHFEPLQKAGRFDILLKGEPIEISRVPFTDADAWAVQSPRYTSLKLILSATHLAGAFAQHTAHPFGPRGS